MEIEPDYVKSSDAFEEFGLDERRQISNETVQDFLDSGLLRLDMVYQRYTRSLSQTLNNAERHKYVGHPDQSLLVDEYRIRVAFLRLRDMESDCLSKDKFSSFMAETKVGFGLTEPDYTALLFDIFSWNAFFPFPESHTGLRVPDINEDAFLRAVCLLTREPAPRHSPEFGAAIHGVYSGTWGSHDGFFISIRGKDSSDFLRRLFRSLAVENSASVNHVTTIAVPRFIMYQEQDSEVKPDRQIVVMENESEVSIDIQDILSECPPNADSFTANPFRESYELVLPSLPNHLHDLSALHVPTSRLVSLLSLLQAKFESLPAELEIDERSELNAMHKLINSVERLGSNGYVDWEPFHRELLGQTRLIASILSRIFGIFKAPLRWSENTSKPLI